MSNYENELRAQEVRSPAEIEEGVFYAITDRWARKGDVLVMVNERVEDPERPGETKLAPRIAARFYGFSPSGSAPDDPGCPDNVAPLMAYMFETMANDGFEATKSHLHSSGIVLLNPRTGILRPDEL